MEEREEAVFTALLTSDDFDRPVHQVPWSLDSSALPTAGMPCWSVRRRRLHGGRQEGVDVIELDNGRLSLVVVPVRGMNVYRAVCDGVRLGWDNPIGQLVHPLWIDPAARGGAGWLEGFNELVSRCGLENTGAPCTDTVIDNRGNERTVNLNLHGGLSNTPAGRVWFSCGLEPPFRLTVGGEVRDGRMFGPSFLLRTEISTVPGSGEFTISDEVVNTWDRPTEMELLYHCNFGAPVLEEGARLVAPVEKLSAANERALEGIAAWDRFGPPKAGFVEQCYLARLHADAGGRTAVALVNRAGTAAVRVAFSRAALPAFTIWKATGSPGAGYVAGLEPGTDYPNPRPFERAQGRVVTLDPGRPYRAAVAIGLTRGRAAVDELCAGVLAPAAGAAPEICPAIDPSLAPR